MYKITVDGIGELVETESMAEAHDSFEAYKDMSDEGMFDYKPVKLWHDKRIIETYKP